MDVILAPSGSIFVDVPAAVGGVGLKGNALVVATAIYLSKFLNEATQWMVKLLLSCCCLETLVWKRGCHGRCRRREKQGASGAETLGQRQIDIIADRLN